MKKVLQLKDFKIEYNGASEDYIDHQGNVYYNEFEFFTINDDIKVFCDHNGYIDSCSKKDGVITEEEENLIQEKLSKFNILSDLQFRGFDVLELEDKEISELIELIRPLLNR